jgi:hypothetical protein
MKAIAAILAAVCVIGLSVVAGAAPVSYTETFDGFTAGSSVGQSSAWSNFSGEPTVVAAGGPDGSKGLSNGSAVFNWTAHPFSWTNDVAAGAKVVLKMDFQTDANAAFDDDRMSWTLNAGSSSSSQEFGAQLDNYSGVCIYAYWRTDAVGGSTYSYKKAIALTGLAANAWYRAETDITKLTATSARIDVTVWKLDSLGNIDLSFTPQVGTFADTSNLGTDTVPVGYFTAATMYPSYKNFSNIAGNADNAYFGVTPEPATMSLLVLGGLALIRRRK